MKMKTMLFILGTSLAFLSSVALAQDTASLTGTIRDKSGAIISNASVLVSNPATNVTREIQTNADGEYLAGALPPGTYDLTVTAAGFKKYEAKGLVLRVAQKSRVDVTLDVGSVATEVVVQGEGLTNVQTESNEEGAVITGKEITQLELNGRNFTQLITLTPGVSNQTGLDEGAEGLGGNVGFSVNGGRTEYNNWEIDGGDNMDNGSNSTLNTYPSLESIGEFRVLTSNYGAQYGRNGSGTIEVETKSGTDHFHGSVYEFLRNDAFNARNFFDSSLNPYKKNDFGYTLGGPIIKSKTYFFWSQEWRYDRVPATFTQVPVPSLAERRGNFNDLCPNAASGSSNDCPKDPATGNPFPGNQVPVDPNGQALLALIPNPTGVFTDGLSAGGSFFSGSTSVPTNWRQELVKVDQDLNSKNRITFRLIHDSWNSTNATALWTNAASFPTDKTAERNPGVSMVAKLTTTATSTLLNEFVFSMTADHIYLQDVGPFQRPSTMTMNGLFGTGTAGKLPGFTLTGGSGSGIDTGFGVDPGFHPEGLYNSNPTYTFRDNVSKVIGKHSFIFGAYMAAAQKNELSFELGAPAGATNGFLTFNGSNSAVSSGNPFADLLMGNIADFGQQNVAAKYYNRYKIVEPYVQDDWHITKRLTLNLGLRLSLFGMYHELNHQAYNFDPSAYVQGATTVPSSGPFAGVAQGLFVNGSSLPNGMVRCGVNGVPEGCLTNHLVNPAPRIGFALDPWGDGKTAIRAGYGIFYEHTNGNESNTESLEDSPPGVLVPVQTNISGYNNIGSVAGGLPPLNVISLPKTNQWPYIQQWHLDFQHEVARNTVATFAYVGTKGTHLTQLFNLNQIQPLPSALNPYAPGEAITPGGQLTPSGGQSECDAASGGQPAFTPIGGKAITLLALQHLNIACGNLPAIESPLLPFPGYANVTRIQDKASSIYHAFQTSLRRTVGRLQLGVAYTWSHSIDDSSDRFDNNFVNTYNLAANRASSNFDQRHILNVNYVYDLPFFTHPGLTNKILGGWQWSGITSFSTGTPLTVSYGTVADNAGVGNGVSAVSSFADRVGDAHTNIPTVTPAPQTAAFLYNPNAFAPPQGLTFGNSGRNSLRNPNRINFDMGLLKNFKITESMGLQFRAEAFNVFNHTEFINDLSNTLGNSGFGQLGAAHNPRILQLALKYMF
jgi:hypothetical protein